MREIETASCDEAADVLALTLTLALEPSSQSSAAAEPGEVPEEKQELLPATAVPSASGTAASRSTPAGTAKDTAASAAEPVPHSKDSAFLFGAELGAASGPTERWGPFGGLFAELEADGDFALRGASARFALVGFHVEDNAPGVAFTTIAGRLDGCPIDLVGMGLRVRPCIGVELGSALAEGRASTGVDDQGLWSAALVSGRLTWLASSAVALGFEVGAYVPLVRYTISSTGSDEGYRADPLGFFGGFSAAWRAP
jgi:hypothetical protein